MPSDVTRPGQPMEADGNAVRARSAALMRRAFPALYFALVTLGFAWPLLLGRSSNVVPGLQGYLWPWKGVAGQPEPLALQRDGALSSYPWSVTYHDALSRFDLPTWDWHSFTGGYDLASDGVSGAMYPMHWVTWLLFEPASGHDVFMAGHLWLGGLTMYLLLRHWTLPLVPALVGGTVWMLSSFNVGWLQAEMITPVLFATPLVFWTVSAALDRGSGPRILAASAALALAVVAGNIVVFLVLIWVAALYAVAWLVVEVARRRDVGALVIWFRTMALVALGGVALSAYSLFPTILNLTSLGRTTTPLSQSLPEQESVATVAARLWNTPELDVPLTLFELHWSGRVALILALIGLFHRGRVRALGLALFGFFTFLPATPVLVNVAWYLIPPLRAVSGLGRLAFLASFGVALLAALGTGVVVARARAWAERAGRTPASAPAFGTAVGAALAGAVIFELLPFAQAVNPAWTARDSDAFFPATAAHAAVRGGPPEGAWPGLTLPLTAPTPGPQAEAWMSSSWWGATSLVHRVDSVGGYDSAVPMRAGALARVLQGIPVGEAVRPFGGAYLPSFSLSGTRLDLIRRMGVTHVYGPPTARLRGSPYYGYLPPLHRIHGGPDGQVWELDDPLRGPRLVGDALVVDTPEAALTAFVEPEHDPETRVVLERRPSDPIPDSDTGAAPVGAVLSSERGSDSARVAFNASRAGWLVVPIGYSAGWSAHLDGERLDLRPADFAFTGVRVPAGEHTVTFQYRPRGMSLGLGVTATTVLLGGLLAAWTLVRRRSSPVPTRTRVQRLPRSSIHLTPR